MNGIKGTTQECLKDFFGRYQWETVQPFVAKYAGVEKPSVLRWRKGSLPKGTELLKLRVLLDILGYHVTEFKVVPGPSRQFSRAIALGLISIDEAADTLGYKSINSLQGLLLRNETPQPFKWHRLERWLEESKSELAKAVNSFQQELEGLPLERSYKPPLVASHPMTPPVMAVLQRLGEAHSEPKPEPATPAQATPPAEAPSEPKPEPAPPVPAARPAARMDHNRPIIRALVYDLMAVRDLLDAIEASPDKDNAIAQFFAITRPEEVKEIARRLDQLNPTG